MHIYIRHGNDNQSKRRKKSNQRLYTHDYSLNSYLQTEQDIINKTKWLIDMYGYPDKIYVSPFKRARSTIHIIDKVLNHNNISVDPCLSRLFVNKEYQNPSVRVTTMQYKPPIR